MMPFDPKQVLPEGVSRVALVGLAKNSGKTTTLNALLDTVDRDRRTVGMVSIGIDGESSDMLIGTRKPTIHASEGDWIVTAHNAISRSGATIEYAESLGFSTPLGDVVVGRVLEAGSVILAGVRHQADLRHALCLLDDHGVDLVFIDGAYGRIVAAQPDISGGVVVSTGAVLGPDIPTIVEKTAYVVDRLVLGKVEASWQRELLEDAVEYEGALLGGPEIDPIELPSRSALLGLDQARDLWSDEIAAIAIVGLVSDSVVESLLAVGGQGRVLLVPDGTVIQCSPRLFARLESTWSIRVGQSIRVLGLSVNPTSVRGDSVDDVELRAALARRWANTPIFNPLHVTGISA
ncbi:MAG: hypothetical protein ACQEVA_17485 [Myxococcota bacterium]